VDVAGLQVFDTKPLVQAGKADAACCVASYEHSYPHCWRCKNRITGYKACRAGS
jgi:isoleucyl-tRNA synthetase